MLAKVEPCPNCGMKLQKNGGCPHMRCTKCKYEFCWNCLGSYKGYRHVDNYTCELVTSARVSLNFTIILSLILKILVLIPWAWTAIYWIILLPITFIGAYGFIGATILIPLELKR